MSDAGGTPLGNVAGFIARAMREGLSQRRTLTELRAAGGAIRDSIFRRTWGEVRATISRYPLVGALDPNIIPSASDYGRWAAGRGGQYATNVAVVVRDRYSGEQFTTYYMHLTNVPHTPGEAMAAAMSTYGDPEIAAQYDQIVQGANVTGMWITEPWAS